jgi:plasmid maintenance system antidote protein VapI
MMEGSVATKRKTKDIVEALRDAIKASGQTHYALAKAADVTPAQLDRFVAGERDLKLETAAKIADALGLVLQARGRA